MNGIFERTEALFGRDALARLRGARALVVGVGGVGGWCAEALARTGFGAVEVIDDDVVAESNLNRQCPATAATVGMDKVEAMKARLEAVNPHCAVTARRERYVGGTDLAGFDVVVDAIDSVDCKAELILAATAAGRPFFSSMGAALRVDPTKVRMTAFDKVEGDGLARALRRRFKTTGRYPVRQFKCVWSAETPRAEAEGRVKGSCMAVTATFGMCLAAAAVRAVAEGGR